MRYGLDHGVTIARGLRLAGALALVLAGASAAQAELLTFTAEGDNQGTPLAARVDFERQGFDLVVTLTNTSSAGVTRPSDVLTAVFFDMALPDGTLTPASAVLGPQSTVLNTSSQPPGGVVSGEWAFRDDMQAGSSVPGDARYGISSVGLNPFGPGDRFPPPDNLAGPESPNGLQYGIAPPAGVDPSGNSKVETEPLIQNQVIFTLSGLPEAFTLSPLTISNLSFQYGTSFGEPHLPGFPAEGGGGGGGGNPVPEPTTLALLGAGAATALLRRRRPDRG